VSVGIAYVDGSRLRRSLLAAADWVAAGRDELNRLNVFPVPDGDTGTNLCLTLRAVAHAIRGLGDARLPDITSAMAAASVRGARGNSGMMMSQFLLGFQEGLGDRLRATARDLAAALRRGFDRLHGSLDDPVEGTILTVVREAADEAHRAANERDIRIFMTRVVSRADAALQRTPDLLAVLKAAGVVDAGAKGFVRFLDGVKRLIEEGQLASGAVDRLVPNVAAQTEVAAERDFQYCTEVLVRGGQRPAAAAARQALRALGGSIVVLDAGDVLKAHIHTDSPQAVFDLAATWGAVEYTKADDMRAQHAALQVTRPITFLADTACDLPDALVFEHGIRLVPTQVIIGDRVYQDRLELTSTEFFGRLRAGVDATTSQPTPQAFSEAFTDALRDAESAIAIVLSGALSGTFANAVAAAQAFDGKARVLNSRSASLGEGMLVLRGIELAAQGSTPDDIVRELERVRGQSGLLFTVETFDRLVRSGRLSRARAWLGNRLNLKPVMALSADGKIVPVARVRGSGGARTRILELLDKALTPRPRLLRFGIVHGDVPVLAEELRAELVSRYQPRQCLVTPITPVVAAHTGVGAWGVFYQVEDT
jgi:DAK2 domain fusion protein YloV